MADDDIRFAFIPVGWALTVVGCTALTYVTYGPYAAVLTLYITPFLGLLVGMIMAETVQVK